MQSPVFGAILTTSPEIIQLAVMLYVRFPLSLRNVEDLLHERGVDVSYDLLGTGGIGLALSSQARSRSAGQGECNSVTGIDRSTEDMII